MHPVTTRPTYHLYLDSGLVELARAAINHVLTGSPRPDPGQASAAAESFFLLRVLARKSGDDSPLDPAILRGATIALSRADSEIKRPLPKAHRAAVELAAERLAAMSRPEYWGETITEALALIGGDA